MAGLGCATVFGRQDSQLLEQMSYKVDDLRGKL